MTDELRAAITRRIDEFIAGSDAELDWLRKAVREHRFLPLELGWTAGSGIRPDGTFVVWTHEADPPTLTPAAGEYDKRLSVCIGARKYPELAVLVPPRPPDAVVCRGCEGSGVPPVPAHLGLTCICGGLGWLLEGEPPRAAGPSC